MHCVAFYVIKYVWLFGSFSEYQGLCRRRALEVSMWLFQIHWIWYVSTNSSRSIFLDPKYLLFDDALAFLRGNAGIDL
jgi:hypothetical protein